MAEDKTTVQVPNAETTSTETTTVEAKVDNIQVIVPGEAPPRTGRIVTQFFNLTAGLEKFIVIALGAMVIYVTKSEWFQDAAGMMTPEGDALAYLLVGLQMLYTQSTTPVPMSMFKTK